ncbi:unnamed protein product [Rotaria sp. Silwood1]|nr:unnamed protein product [Rotaria sp. Silwood1]CAF4972581.1 unnamed protein product [Rotaria sp. Silwood1]
MPPTSDNYSSIKDQIVEECIEFCALDDKPFDTVIGEGFINLAKQLMNAGALTGTGFSVNDLLPHSTTIRQSHKQSSLFVCVQNYCKTRFSTVYVMLNTFLMVYNELPSVLNSNQRQNFLKTNNIELEQLTKYLNHFHDVSEKLCCEQTAILHLLIPYK